MNATTPSPRTPDQQLLDIVAHADRARADYLDRHAHVCGACGTRCVGRCA